MQQKAVRRFKQMTDMMQFSLLTDHVYYSEEGISRERSAGRVAVGSYCIVSKFTA